jgi:FKBP-type peptidyl-prolyl cis-trans isomerase
MKVGGVRKLTIPATQAYGSAGSPPTIPADTPLTFIVQVTAINK